MEEKLKELVEKGINSLIENGINMSDLDTLSKLVDIHKDLSNEKYWEIKEEAKMRYRDYDEYGRGNYSRRNRDNRGRYQHRGEEMMDEMYGAYQRYSNGREEMDMGNYGAKSNTIKSLDYMLQSVVDFIEMLKKDASSQEEVQLIQEYTRQISEM